MKKILIALTLIAFAWSNQSCVRKDSPKSFASGNIVTKEIPVTEYSIISSAFPCDLVYEQKDAPAYLKVEVDENLLDKIGVSVKDSTLQLQLQEGISFSFNSKKAVVYTNSKELKLLAMTGSGDTYLKGLIKSKRMDLRLSGSGDIKVDNLDCETLSLSVSGSGDAQIEGKAIAAAYNMNGSGDIQARDFVVDNLRVYLSGSGNAKVHATKYVYANLNGSGDIRYTGKPEKVEKDINGSGSVEAE
jgi:hypothetical protein